MVFFLSNFPSSPKDNTHTVFSAPARVVGSKLIEMRTSGLVSKLQSLSAKTVGRGERPLTAYNHTDVFKWVFRRTDKEGFDNVHLRIPNRPKTPERWFRKEFSGFSKFLVARNVDVCGKSAASRKPGLLCKRRFTRFAYTPGIIVFEVFDFIATAPNGGSELSFPKSNC